MKILDYPLFQQLISEEALICLTMYIPVGKEVSDVSSNMLRLKNLVKEVKSNNNHDPQINTILQSVEHKLEDTELFKGYEGCIGFFVSTSGFFETVYLPACSDTFYHIDQVFYIVPLIDLIPNLKQYFILSLAKNSVRLYRGDFYGLEEVTLVSEVPRSMQEALGTELTDNHLHAAAGGSATLHGYMEITDEKEVDNERFFRVIDNAIYEHYSKQENLPLYLATISENLHTFKKISKNPYLAKEHIEISAKTASTSDLHRAIKEIITNQQTHELHKIIELFYIAKNKDLTSEQLSQVAQNVIDARVAQLFLGKGRKIYGDVLLEERTIKIDPNSQKDILNRLAILAYKSGSTTHIVHPKDLLLNEGAAAIIRS